MGPALHLRALERADAPAVHVIASEPVVARTLGSTPLDFEEAWAAMIGDAAPDRALFLGAFEGGELLGFGRLEIEHALRRRHVATISVGVRGDAQRRGVGDRLVGALVETADRWWGIVRIELGVLAENVAAIALYEKHGFVVETRRRKGMFVDGALADDLGMARLRPGWVPLPALGVAPPIGPRGPRREVTIRARRTSDAEAFARLHEAASVMEGTFQLPYQTRAAWDARFAATPPGSSVLVGEMEGRVVASAGLFPLGRSPRFRHAAMFGLSVHPDVQGQGVGDAMMRAALDQADRWLGLTRVVLEVFVDNDRACALYERHGFVVEGVERAMAMRRGTHADSYLMARVRG